jgi:hypothetical protein
VLATHDQLPSIEEREQTISPTDRSAALNVPQIHDGAAMNSHEGRRT